MRHHCLARFFLILGFEEFFICSGHSPVVATLLESIFPVGELWKFLHEPFIVCEGRFQASGQEHMIQNRVAITYSLYFLFNLLWI